MNEMGFTKRKAEWKPALTHKQKKMSLRIVKEKQIWLVVNWMKVILSDESRIYIGHSDDPGAFVWCHSNETHGYDCLKKISKLLELFMIWGCMSFKEPGDLAIVISTINTKAYIEILDNFIIPRIENYFVDEIIFQDDNASCHKAKWTKVSFKERHIESMTGPANSPDLNPIENLWWKFRKMVHEDASFTKEDQLMPFRKDETILMKNIGLN